MLHLFALAWNKSCFRLSLYVYSSCALADVAIYISLYSVVALSILVLNRSGVSNITLDSQVQISLVNRFRLNFFGKYH